MLKALNNTQNLTLHNFPLSSFPKREEKRQNFKMRENRKNKIERELFIDNETRLAEEDSCFTQSRDTF